MPEKRFIRLRFWVKVNGQVMVNAHFKIPDARVFSKAFDKFPKN